jgi:hypothetical protein
VLHRFDENMGTEGLRQSAKLSETFGIIRICLLTSDRQEFARFANVGDLNGKTERTEISNHLSADTGLDRNRLDRLNAKPAKDIPYRSSAGLSHCLEENVSFGIDEADGSLQVAGVEADPVAQVPWHCAPVRRLFLLLALLTLSGLSD